MNTRRWTMSALCALIVLVASGPAYATLSISVPASASLGSGPAGSGTRTAQLGVITVTDTAILTPGFTATVASTTFVTGGGSANETIGLANVSYWSGAATSASGGTLLVPVPGQATSANKVVLTSSRTAFSASAATGGITVKWNPTLIVTIPASSVVGTYTGTITHSVA